MATPIAASDLTWLLMDRPNNLMHVHGLLIFERLPDWELLRNAILDRIVTKYRVLSQIPVHRDGHWEWHDDLQFRLSRHVRRVYLDDSSEDALREYLSAQFAVPFDRAHPLWDMQLISGPPGDVGGGAMLTRFHHGLGDGIRLVQLLLGTCDPAEGATPRTVGRTGNDHGPLGTVLHVTERSMKDTLDLVLHAGGAAAQLGRKVVATLNPLELPHHFETVVDLARHPVKVIDAVTSFASEDNEMSNSWREIGRLLLADKADTHAWSGHPGLDKGVVWIEGISLAEVKLAAKHLGGTVNDTLMSAVSLAMTDYLAGRGVTDVEDLGWLMPVSLRPVDGSLPSTLGNHFALVLFPMPIGISDPAELVGEIHQRTNRLKHSAEPVLAFGMQRVIAESPGAVAKRITDFFSSKSVGQLTNVPGPSAQLRMVGAPVRTVLGWVPTSGDQPIGVCLFTYNGTVSIGVAVDIRMIPDPMSITELIGIHIDRLVASANPSPTDS